MKKLILLVILLLTGTIKADYAPPTLNELILKADKILYGEIQCVDATVIEVGLQGSIDEDLVSIKISKFKEWNCGKRWMEYQVGQTSLFFLTLKNGEYHPMGGGNEGELPIRNDKVYVHASTISSIDYVSQFERSTITMEDNGFNNPFNGYALEFYELWQAIDLINKCFTSDVNAVGKLFNIQQKCPTTEFGSVIEQNSIFRWALGKLES
ncbi:MAG: hypothetical protein KJO94_02430 [Eudoraea sp.]|nr:hypothetical protein [Eudoraea sp.]MBT8322312.1 hypothetical protein [Eudoraea sp.]